LNDTESSVRICRAWIEAVLAPARVDDAFARERDESVPHLAAEYPDQAAMSATIDRRTASAIEITRSRRV